MKTMTTLRARCLYSRVAQFTPSHLYTFERVFESESYDVYVTDDDFFSFHYYRHSRAILIEDLDGVVAAFEIYLKCTA